MTQRNGKGSLPRAMARDMGHVAQAVVELAELQWSLAWLEIRVWSRKLIFPAVLFVSACVFAVTCLVILLLSAGYALAHFVPMNLALALCIVGCAGIVVSCLSGLVARRLWKSAVHLPFSQSRHELARNMRWFKTTVTGAVHHEMESSDEES
jgi:hypothetical protein